MTAKRWIDETLHPGFRTGLEAGRVLEQRKTEFQDLVVFENAAFGRVLMLDGCVQMTTADEFMYHEMMAHVPLLAHGQADDVLIVGGGDCGLAEEVLKHPGVKRLTQVEIDPQVVEVGRQYFSDVNGPVFTDERFKLHIGDGVRFVAETQECFDVVMVDSTDPIGPGKVLFTEEFYRSVRARLKPGGVMVNQCSIPFLQGKEFASAMRAMKSVFPIATCYLIAVPTYSGGHLAIGWASEKLAPDVPVETLASRFATLQLSTRYYTPEVHRAAFALPPFVAGLF